MLSCWFGSTDLQNSHCSDGNIIYPIRRMRDKRIQRPMITTYPTCRTAELRNLRHQTLSTPGTSTIVQNPGMLLRVDSGNRNLLNNWVINHDDNKPVVLDDSPYAGGLGIATFVFDGSQAIDERRRSWSHSKRRSRGVIQT